MTGTPRPAAAHGGRRVAPDYTALSQKTALSQACLGSVAPPAVNTGRKFGRRDDPPATPDAQRRRDGYLGRLIYSMLPVSVGFIYRAGVRR